MARELLGDSGQAMLSLQLLLIDLSANDNLMTGGRALTLTDSNRMTASLDAGYDRHEIQRSLTPGTLQRLVNCFTYPSAP